METVRDVLKLFLLLHFYFPSSVDIQSRSPQLDRSQSMDFKVRDKRCYYDTKFENVTLKINK